MGLLNNEAFNRIGSNPNLPLGSFPLVLRRPFLEAEAYSRLLGVVTGPGEASSSFFFSSGAGTVAAVVTSSWVDPGLDPDPRLMVTYSKLRGVVAWLIG